MPPEHAHAPVRINNPPAPEKTSGNPVDIAGRLIIQRNKAYNAITGTGTLTETPTDETRDMAQKLVAYQKDLAKYGSPRIAADFLTNPYNLLWFEQLIVIDPKKAALAFETRHRVDQLKLEGAVKDQYVPAVSLAIFVELEKLDMLGLSGTPTARAAEILRTQAKTEKTPGSKALLNQLSSHLLLLPEKSRGLTGKDRDIQLTRVLAGHYNRKLEAGSRRAEILNQSQGIEVEVLKPLEYVPTEKRADPKLVKSYTPHGYDRFKKQMVWSDFHGLAGKWLPRGIKETELGRRDWMLTNILGLPEDVGEKRNEWFEMSTRPTDSGHPQTFMLYKLVQGGFIDEKILSDIREKYSMHASTVFPAEAWNTRSENQYRQLARAFSGAFASVQRGVYGGYVFDDNPRSGGREVANKTFESRKFVTLKDASGKPVTAGRLVEMRVMDLTEKGQYAFENYKPYYDFAFRSYWMRQAGHPPVSVAQHRAANVWGQFYDELQDALNRRQIPDAWSGVGRAKEKNPALKKELDGLIRRHGNRIARIVNMEMNQSEPSVLPDKPGPTIFTDKEAFTEIPESDRNIDPIMQLSSQEATRYGLKNTDFITVSFGGNKISTRVSIDNYSPESTRGVDRNIIRQTGLPTGLPLSGIYDPLSRELGFGPVLAVAANVESGVGGISFGDQSGYNRDLIAAARNKGMFAYIFDPKSIRADRIKAVRTGTGEDASYTKYNLNNRFLDGYTLTPDGKGWENVRVPQPDVLFDRTLGGLSGFPDQVRDHFARIPWINDRKFGEYISHKLSFPESLAAHPALSGHIPETKSLRDPADLEQMLARHGTVYLKPVLGMRSHGIIRVRLDDNGKISYTVSRPGSDTEDQSYVFPKPGEPDFQDKTAVNGKQLFRDTQQIRDRWGKSGYVVQQGIRMTHRDKFNDPFEIRFLYQRDARGNLVLTGWDEVQDSHWTREFGRVFGESNARTVADNTRNLAGAVAARTQLSFGSAFGQFSVQVAVDDNGKPWFMEANPKPGVSNQFLAYGRPELAGQTVDRVIDLAKTSAGFGSESMLPRKSAGITLKDGTSAEILEERNPRVIYEFARHTKGEDLLSAERTVYNLRSPDRIREILARRGTFLTLRQNGRIIGCAAIIRPTAADLIHTTTRKLTETRLRWEIGAVLTDPKSRNKGVAAELFDAAVNEIRSAPPVWDARNKSYVDEIRVDVTGTLDRNQLGTPRPDSAGMVNLIRRYPHKLLGALLLSFGPSYAIPIRPDNRKIPAEVKINR